MTSVNVTTQKNTVTVQQGDATTVTVATVGPQGPSLPDGNKGDVTVSNNGTAISINNDVITTDKLADDCVTIHQIADNAVGSNQINAQAIFNSDINDSAAIAGTKISPNFGNQTISGGQGQFSTNTNNQILLIDADSSGTTDAKVALGFRNGSDVSLGKIGPFLDNSNIYIQNDVNNGFVGIRTKSGNNITQRFTVNTTGAEINGNLVVTGNAVFDGNLTVSGTTTTINTQTLDVEDINITLGKVGSPTDITANEGGISLLGDTTKTFQWLNATDSWTSSEHIALPDNKKLQLGDSLDLTLFHDGSNSRIQDSGTGFLLLDTNTLMIRKVDGSETMAKFIANGSAELYYDNIKKAETSANGFNIIGTLTSSAHIDLPDSTSNAVGRIRLGDGTDMQMFHDGGGGFIGNFTGNLNIHSNGLRLLNGAKTETYISANENSSVELYYDNVKKVETSADGLDLPDNSKLQLGTSQNLQIFHSGSVAKIINDTGNFNIQGNSIRLFNQAGTEFYITCTANAGVDLYFDGTKKAGTSADGLDVTSNAANVGTTILSNTSITNHNYQYGAGGTERSGLTIKANEPMLEIIANDNGTHAGSFLLRDSGNDGFGFVNDPTNNQLQLKSFSTSNNNFRINGTGNNVSRLDDCIVITKDGSVSLFYDAVKRFETSSLGITVTGTVTDDGATHDGDVTFTGDSANVVFDKSDNALEFADDAKLIFGDGGDVNIRHSGGRTMIRNHGIGQIHFDLLASGNAFAITKANLTETIAKFTPDSSCDLYFDNVKRFETIDGGSKITGSLGVNTDPDTPIHILANDAQLLTVQRQGVNNATIRYRNDTASMFCGLTSNATGFAIDNDDNLASGPMLFVDRSTGNVGINSSIPSEALFINGNLALAASSGDNPTLKTTGTDNGDLLIESGSDSMAIFQRNANVQLFYDGVLAAQTVSTGLNVIGTAIKLRNTANNADLIKLFHSGTGGNGLITSEIGDVKIQPNEDGGQVKLFETTSGTTTQRLATTSNGVTVSGNLSTGNIASVHDGNTSISIRDTGHNFSASEIKLSNGGRDLNIVAPKDIRLFTQQGENAIVMEANAQVELYFNALEKARTSSTGLDVTGAVKASTGILFGSDTADANTLADYEEGTWTPTVLSEGNIGTPQYTCTYTKIGRLVTINADIHQLSDTTSSTNIKIGGLPYVPSGTGTTGKEFSAACHGERYKGGNSNGIVAYLLYNSGAWGISFRFGVPSGHYAEVKHSDISDDGTDNNVRFTLTYELV